MTQDEKDLINEKIGGLSSLINAQFINVHERLDEIKEQTTKTNGRVTELERDLLVHPITCSQGVKIEAINKTLEDIKFFVKYPKLAVGIASVFILVFLGSAVMFYGGLSRNLKQSRENTELIIKNDSTLKAMK